MASSRNYKLEYARRLARANARGLSRSQARGHARASETHVKAPKLSLSDDRVQAALQALKKERNISLAARFAKISTERLRKHAIEKGLIEKEGRRWKIAAALPRRMPVFSKGRVVTITVASAGEASEVGRFMSAAGRFLESNKLQHLEPFAGHGVQDIAGRYHPFETNPSTLYRLGAGGEASFEQIYRIVI